MRGHQSQNEEFITADGETARLICNAFQINFEKFKKYNSQFKTLTCFKPFEQNTLVQFEEKVMAQNCFFFFILDVCFFWPSQ